MSGSRSHELTKGQTKRKQAAPMASVVQPDHALIKNDLALLSEHAAQWVIGVDEAGRGPLAGPVYAGAVALHREWLKDAIGHGCWQAVHDSKKLKPYIRDSLYQSFRTGNPPRIGAPAPQWCSGAASVQEIEELNILEATKRAMYRAIAGVSAHLPNGESELPRWTENEDWTLQEETYPEHNEFLILIDGLPLKRFPWKHRAMVKGDGSSFAIALASIIAKVERDAMMACLHADHPEYGWNRNQGYGTPSHIKAIQNKGITQWHRPSFLTKFKL